MPLSIFGLLTTTTFIRLTSVIITFGYVSSVAYLVTVMPRAIRAIAKTKIRNFVGKHSPSNNPTPKVESAMPAHLPLEHTRNTSFPHFLLHYMRRDENVIIAVYVEFIA